MISEEHRSSLGPSEEFSSREPMHCSLSAVLYHKVVKKSQATSIGGMPFLKFTQSRLTLQSPSGLPDAHARGYF